jgi:hypothetical protein
MQRVSIDMPTTMSGADRARALSLCRRRHTIEAKQADWPLAPELLTRDRSNG